jgi:lysozyme
MTASQNCINIIKMFEGYKAKAYICPAGKVTIGWGSLLYTDGRKVKMGDTINEQQATEMLMWELKKKSVCLQGLKLNQNQFDACLSFVYNCGVTAFNDSTLKRKIVANRQDLSIRSEFLRWVNKGSAFEKGLTRRRKIESELYFKI